MILEGGLMADASFVVLPKGSDQANGPPVITPTKANVVDYPMDSLVGDPDHEFENPGAVEKVGVNSDVGDDMMDVDKPGLVGKAGNSEEVIIFDSDDASDDPMEITIGHPDPEVETP